MRRTRRKREIRASHCGFSIGEMAKCGFSAEELRLAAFSASELKNVLGMTAKELREGGYSMDAIKAARFEPWQMKELR